MGGTAGVKIEL